MARRSSGEGSIYQRESDGKWVGALTLNGRRKAVYGNTRKEAAENLARLREEVGAGPLPDPGRRTVSDLLDAWLEAVSPTLKPRTVHDYGKEVELHIRPALGSLRLSRITPDKVHLFLARIQKRGYHRLAERLYCRLRSIFKMAVLWGWLGSNPVGKVVRPQYRPERKEVWSREELAAFLERTDGSRWHPLWVVLISTGCRLGEVLALGWTGVDFDGGTITVCRTLHRIGGEWVFSPPKTKSGQRKISLPPGAIAALHSQRAVQAAQRLRAGQAWKDTGLAFTQDNGEPVHGTVVAHALKRECRRLGITEITPHGLRHLHASLLLQQGLPVPAVSQRLGHANPGITMSVYAHVIGNQDGGAAKAIDDALAQNGR